MRLSGAAYFYLLGNRHVKQHTMHAFGSVLSSACLSVFVSLSASESFCLSIRLSTRRSVCLSVRLSVRPSAHLSISSPPPTLCLRVPCEKVHFVFFSCHSTKMQSVVSTRGFIKVHLPGVKSGVCPVRCISHCKTVNLKMEKNGLRGDCFPCPPPPPPLLSPPPPVPPLLPLSPTTILTWLEPCIGMLCLVKF